MQVHFEPHPVTPERKAELRAQGLKIIDARFAPPGAVVEPKDEAPKQRARKPRPVEGE